MPPSPWVERWANRVPSVAPVLDVACGGGRHTRMFLERGHNVTAVDRDCSWLGELHHHPLATVIAIDLEAAAPIPGRQFGAVVVTNFLLRPLFPSLIGALAVGGYLICETFTVDHARFHTPINPAHLAASGELADLVAGELAVLAYEEGVVDEGGRRAALARVVAHRR